MGQRLHYQMQGRTKKEVAALAGITENALGRLMRGEAWGALPIIIRLERALNSRPLVREARLAETSWRSPLRSG